MSYPRANLSALALLAGLILLASVFARPPGAAQDSSRPEVARVAAPPPRGAGASVPGPALLDIEDPRPMQGLPPADLRVLYTATVNGYLEPCGCVAGRMGGIDRIAAYVADQRRRHPAVLYVDGGDLFHDDLHAAGPLALQLPLKAETFFAALGQLGIDAMAVGEFDLVLGVDALLDLSRTHSVPLLCGNLIDASGKRPFESYRIVERDGLRVGIFALLADQIQHTGTEDKKLVKVDTRPRLEELGLRTETYTEAAGRILAELEPQVDRLVLVSHLGLARNRRLAELYPQLDLILGGHVETATSETTWVNGVPIALVYNRGARVGRIDFWWQRGGGQRPVPPAGDVSSRLRNSIEAGTVQRDLERLAGRSAVLGEREYDRRRKASLELLAQLPAVLEASPPLPKGSLFAHALVPMFEGIGRDEAVLTELDRYHTSLPELWPPALETRQNTRFVAPENCQSCHPSQYDFWKGMRHSRAWHTLEVTSQQYDAECIGCHSVGFGEPGGYLRPNQVAGFENVQCASCHGPAERHISHPTGYLDARFLKPSERCGQCHDKHHDPRFDLAKKLPLVTCPPLPSPGQGTAELLAALQRAADAASTAGDWSLATQAQRRRADFAAVLESARRWREGEPTSLRARQFEAEALIELGQQGAAREVLEKLLPRTQSDPLVWSLYARALLALNPAEAMPAAREAYSLAPDFPENAVLMARICVALGQRLDALDVLRAHLERLPEHAPVIQPVIDEIGGLASPR
jgi:hypothetical protein